MSHLHSLRLVAGALPTLAAVVLLAGCASTTPELDAGFGNAVHQARTDQVINPNASANRDPVLGIDGKAGAAAQTRYQDSFRTPPRTFDAGNIGGALSEN